MNQKGNVLLIVILSIVGVIAAGVIITMIFLAGSGTGAYQVAQIDARNSKRKADVDLITKGLELHYGQTQDNTYPAVSGDWFVRKSIPTDPNGASYSGVPTSSVPSFKVCATLEGSNPPYCVDSVHK